MTFRHFRPPQPGKFGSADAATFDRAQPVQIAPASAPNPRSTMTPQRTLTLTIAAAIALGFEGGRLLAWRLQRRGFTEGDVVIGDDEEEAEEVFFGRLRAAAPRTLSAEAGA